MAKPLTLQMEPRDARQELVAKLQKAPVTHAAAILEWYELLQELHDSGVMSTLRGAAGEGGEILKQVSAGLNTPDSIRAMRNLVALAKLMGKLDPEVLRSILLSVPESLTDANARQMETPGVWALFRSFTTRESRRTLGVAAGILNAVGRALVSHPRGT